MNKLTVQILFLFITITTFAQQKELTLEDAVLKRFSTLGPERLPDLQWVKNTSMVSWQSKDRDKILIRKPGSRSPIQEVSVEEIDTTLGLELKRIPSVKWVGSGNFYFQSKGVFYTYSVSSKTGKKLLTLPEETANVDYHEGTNHAAYTKENNLFIVDGSGTEQAVTEFDDKNIVSGQAIARFEFGISKGTFWSPKGSYLAFYQKDETDVADYPLLDVTTTPGSLQTIKYPMAGQTSEYGKVGIYDVEKGKVVYLKVDGPKDQYVTNLGWGPEEQYVYIAVVNRDQNHMWLNKYDAKSGNLVKTLFEEKHPKYVEPENPVWFLPNNPNEFC